MQANESAPITQIDWAQEWRDMRKARKLSDNPERWNKRAPSFSCGSTTSPYAKAFIEMLDLQPGDSAFDMGCGNGSIAIPLAQRGHQVVARDFSTGMLEELERRAAEADMLDMIDFAQMSWEDDWAAAGLEPGMVDVAFASRSMITSDLAASIEKLSSMAKRHACATISTGYIPAFSPTILRDLGMEIQPSNDMQFTFNILLQLGYAPSLNYIVTDRIITFGDWTQAEENILRMIDTVEAGYACEGGDIARTRVSDWVRDHAVSRETENGVLGHGDGDKAIVVNDDVHWAFFKWDVLR